MEKKPPNFLQCPVCRTSHVPKTGDIKNGVYATTCENCGHFFKFKATGNVKSNINFTINGKSYSVDNKYSAALSLNEFMRGEGISYGTKAMCIEGGCGVCLVTTTLFDPVAKAMKTYTVNSCLLLLYACDGMQVTTIEGLGNPRDGLHPIQDRLAQYNGSQCGFCSPAQVMNMYGLLKREPKPSMQQVEDTYDSTICRCTGYRPILDAMKSFASDAPPTLPGGPIDIEELDKKLCSKTGQACTGRCSSSGEQLDNVPLHMVLRGAQWYKPTSKQELYSLLGQHKGDNYRLVFGNSGYGVYKDIGVWMYSVLIDLRGIHDFFSINVDPTKHAVFGANVSLSSLIKTFMDKGTETGFPYFRDFARYLGEVATTGVRNLGSWAGNLMLKHLHTEFPSDVFTMFEAVGATLLIGSSDGTEKVFTLTEFLSTDMKGKVIVSVTLPVFTSSDVFIRSFKIGLRHQNTHAYVNSTIRMRLDRNKNYTVKSKPSLVYGGINKTMIHATQTENLLVGKELGDSKVLKSAIDSLSSEIVPDTTAGLSSNGYRKSLAISLFYKFVLGMCSDKTAPSFRSGGTDLIRPLSSGTQTYDTHKDEWPLTQPITKKDATLQTSGRAVYVNDTPPMPGELYASFVISSVGNAEINSVDSSAALNHPGVLKYISASDIPSGGTNTFMPPGNQVDEIFSSGKITYSGQPIGMVVAVDKLTADTGASMVKVTYKNVQSPIISIRDAVKKGSVFKDIGDELKIGDAAKAISNSDKSVTGSVSMGNQYHFQLETHVTISYPTEDGEGLSLLSATQWGDATQQIVAKMLNIKENSVNVETKRLGGAYGSKISRAFLAACGSSLAAYILRRPVRLAMNFHTNMKSLGSRYPYVADYEVGFSNEGKLNGIKVTVIGDLGNTKNDSALSMLSVWLDNGYYCPAWDFKPIGVRTNLPANTWTRGPGSCEAIFIMETMMEHVSKALNKDPLEVRKLNLYNQGQKSISGMLLEYCDIKDIVAQLETSADVQSRKQKIEAFNKANRWRKRGISVQPIRWDLDARYQLFNVFLTVYHGDGSVAVSIGGVENGQGIQTKMMQVCAYELGIPIDSIKVKATTTLANANSFTTGGSITSEVNALGIINCCTQLKARMAPVKAKMHNPTWQQLVAKSYADGVDLSARAELNPTDLKYDYNIYGATCTEVELDVLTGENQITRVDILYDCGESMNPEIDIGQAEGGFVMGLGYWMTEQLIFDPKTAVNLTSGTWEYKPPMAKDIPIDFRIQFLKNHPNKRGVLRSKAVGEPPLCMASSALFAIKHAVEAARKEAGKLDYFQLNGPATVEAVQTACQVDPRQLVFGT